MAVNYMTVQRRGDDVSVLVGEYDAGPPAEVYRDKLIPMMWVLRTAWVALDNSMRYDRRPTSRSQIGEIRRAPDGTVAVNTEKHGLWKVIGHDPEPLHYGWRDDRDVIDWEITGNVLGEVS